MNKLYKQKVNNSQQNISVIMKDCVQNESHSSAYTYYKYISIIIIFF